MDFNIHIADWELTEPFRIAGAEWTNSRCLVVQLDCHMPYEKLAAIHATRPGAELVIAG